MKKLLWICAASWLVANAEVYAQNELQREHHMGAHNCAWHELGS